MSREEQVRFDLGGWHRGQARATPLAEAKQESCGTCLFFQPELKPLSRRPEGYCLAQYNRPRLTTDEPCNKWRPDQAAPASEPRSKRVSNGRS